MSPPLEFSQIDRDLIADEESRYAKTFTRVTQAFKEKTAELGDNENLARALTAELVATRNDEEKQSLQSGEHVAHGLARLRHKQANALSDLAKQPYFARVIYHEKGRDVEFKLGVASFPEERIIDWRRGPISKLYYDYEEGDAYDDEIAGVERQGAIKLKRAYRGNRDELSHIELKDLSFSKVSGAWRRFKKQVSAPFSVKDKERVRELIKNHEPISPEQFAQDDGYLSQILSLLSPEQFRLISSDLAHPVVIQGSAGTGKTTVALHRLAWMLFEGNSRAREENCLVVMFNPTLAKYVRNILPSLGVHGVKIATYHEWARDVIATSLPERGTRYVPPDDITPLMQKIFTRDGCYNSKRFPARLDHLVIDEAQDFTLPELKVLLNALEDKSQLTIAGDLGQKILSGRDFGSWRELLDKLDLSGVDVLNLSIAYRSTYQIYEIAEHVRDPNLSDDDLKMFPRFGPDPLLTVAHNFDEAADIAKTWIEDVITVNQKAIGALVCRNADVARQVFNALTRRGVRGMRLGDTQHFEFTPGITVTDVSQVKGLEFQSVLIFNPSEREYPSVSSRDRNLLYVAVTRAVYRCDFVCYEKPSRLVPEFVNTNDLTAVVIEDDNPTRLLFDLTPEEQAAMKERRGDAPRDETDVEDNEDEGERDMLDELTDGADVPLDDMDAEDAPDVFPEENED